MTGQNGPLRYCDRRRVIRNRHKLNFREWPGLFHIWFAIGTSAECRRWRMTECAKSRWELRERSRCACCRASCQSVQGRHAAAGAGDPGHDPDHGKRSPQCGQAISGCGRERGGHCDRCPAPCRYAGGPQCSSRSEIIKVEGKRIEFKVSARDEMEEIGNGLHQRVVINLRSFNEHLATKNKR